MFKKQVQEKAREAAAKGKEWRAAVDGDVPEGTDAETLTKELTALNVELHELKAKQDAFEVAEAAERELLAVDESKRTRKGYSLADEREEGKQKKLKTEIHCDAIAAYLNEGHGAAVDLCRTRGMGPTEISTLISGDATKGGILVAPEWAEIYEGRIAPTIMRDLVDVQTTDSDILVVPVFDSDLEADAWTTEAKEHSDRQDLATEGVEVIIHDWHPKHVVVSQKLLRNSGARVDSIVASRILRRKSLDEDRAIVNGNGAGRPMGVMQDPAITAETDSLAEDGFTWAGILNWIYTLPEEWSAGAVAIMRRLTFASILGTPDPAGHYIFAVSAQAAPETILGNPVKFSGDMPAMALNAYPAIFGNFSAYTLAENPGATRIKRLDEKYDPNVGFSMLALLGGKAIDGDAFVKIKQAA